ncbi:MAG: hypothetical protein ACM3KM_00410 [Acidobacteriaceae bacterium]
MNLLIFHEIEYKASLVKSKKMLKEFETWLSETVSSYRDAAIEHYARIQLFRVREQFA